MLECEGVTCRWATGLGRCWSRAGWEAYRKLSYKQIEGSHGWIPFITLSNALFILPSPINFDILEQVGAGSLSLLADRTTPGTGQTTTGQGRKVNRVVFQVITSQIEWTLVDFMG